MLTGGPLYTGKTVSHVLADVLRADPDWNRLPVNLHPRIRMLLERCLEKDPRDRYHDIADARVDLEHVLADPGGVFIQTAPDAAPTKQAGSRVLFWGCIAASALVASSLGWFLRPAPIAIPASVVRFPFVLPDPTQLPTQPVSLLAISPDGTKIAYAANAQIYLRNLNETVARPIPGTNEGGTGPGALVFSPDGMTLGYVHVVTLTGPFFIKRVPVSGGTPVKLNEAPPGLRNFQYGLSWPTLDTMVYANADGIVKITANGGSPEVLVKRVAGESFESPQMLPGGKQILFTRLTEEPGGTGVARWDAAEIVIQSAGGNDRTVVWKGGSHARYLQTGHLLYALGNTLFAISLDLTSRKVIGSPIPILEGVQRSSNGFSDVAQYSVSDSGVVVSMPATNTNNPEKGILGLVDRNGVTTPFAVQPAQYRGPRLSPDEKQLAVEINGDDGKSSIWIYDMSGKSEIRRLTEAGTISTRPIWTRDGKWITFGSQRDGAWGIYQIPADGSALAKRLFAAKDKIKVYPESWSPDGKTLTFAQITSSDTDWDIWTFSTSDAVTSLVAGGPGSQFGSSFSPDGRWIVYTDNQDPFGLRAQPFPTTGVIHQLTQDGEAWPVWTTGGRIISRFRRDSGGRAQLREVQVNASNEITLNNPHTIPLPDALIYQNYRDFAVTKSGEAFVALLPEQKLGKTNPPAAPTFRIDVILNWFEELKQRIPSK
jgi:Tol biopolymer transport system component